MASKKKITVTVPKSDVIDLVMDVDQFNSLISHLQTLINFAEGAVSSLNKLKATLATISTI